MRAAIATREASAGCKARRTFWQSLFKSLLDSPALINQSKEALDAHLSTILDQSVSQSSGFGRVDFVGAGPGVLI